MLAGEPDADVVVPAAVRALAGGAPTRPVWHNLLGGLTFELGGEERRFVKWTPASSGIDLTREAERLRWAARFVAVPLVLDHGNDGDGEWLVTRAIAGENAVTERWKADPRTAVRAVGGGLRALHDALPVDGCPFSWSAEERVEVARGRASAGLVVPDRWHDDHRAFDVDEALERIAAIPPVDRLVVCHGDSCAPNTLIGDDGRCTGHVDLGSLGVADRWADLAVASWSTGWNYGPGWDDELLDAYGVDPDPERTAYYRLLWDLGP